jgi:hypothetical protein
LVSTRRIARGATATLRRLFFHLSNSPVSWQHFMPFPLPEAHLATKKGMMSKPVTPESRDRYGSKWSPGNFIESEK